MRPIEAQTAQMSATSAAEWPQWLTRRETAAYVRARHGMQFGIAALANAATNGTGPPYTKQGGKLVAYWRPDVDEWARARMSRKVRSTSELRLPPAA